MVSIAKESGLGWTTLSVDDASASPQAIKNDVTNFEFATPRAVQDVTGVDKSAFERLLLLADFSCTFNGVFNDAANQSHAVFKTMKFWLRIGVDGLRLDAIPYLIEREGTNCENLPETHVVLKSLRAALDEEFPGRIFLA